MTADNILNTSAADLMANRRVTDLLGTTKAFEGSDPRAFSMKLKSYIDSKGKRGRSKKSARSQDAAEHPDSASDTDTANQGIGLWPLVRVVRIYTKAPALATGAVLVDLPGIFDSNAARVAVAEDYMRRCSAHWIVAPINRAVDDKVARDLLGKNYKLQMQMDCAFNDMTFICTKTDDIVPTEVIQSLGLDLPAFNEVQQLPARVELMMGEIDALKEAKKKISTQLDLIETEIEDLEERLNDEFGCDVLEITPKRKKPHGHEPSETPTVHEASATELSEVDKLKNQFLKLKVERKALRSQRKHINQQMENKEAELQKLEDGKKEMEHAVLSSCIEARNRFSKCQIKRGFALEIQSLDQEIADDDSENPDMGAHKNRFNRTVRDIFQQNILNKLSGASRHAILQFPEAVSRWNEGLRWNTYKAICRRRGVYRTTPIQDWNRDLARPMFDKIAAAWRRYIYDRKSFNESNVNRTFNELLPHAMRTMTDDLEVVLGRFHKKAIDSVEQDVSDETKKRLQSTLVACQQSMRQRFWEMRLGSWKRSRALMQQVADDHANDVLRGSTEHAKHELKELLDSQEAEVDRIIQSRLRRISRDYHGALIAPQIQLCTEEQARIKSEVAKIVERAEAELQLGHLLGGVRSS
ncbi:hypothetical protein ASPNIDRAFT_42828 [Aspergillus niger ATCC 1015]|uniref:DUF7605 domain-containing protein n=1 Tax=Aspergillus niger (strain ATCC 1015 / CBS 113.46 / FGSC A1144 / LSHB Ac4 / NCTC 3858a / NRRL 328 / USDA 3528.7) TaxID=380704 RepID=G3YDZ9_ASPNA|nr:hypothetical protein ASPNIDRAFT_42828 [Aspergillus niger ATCC 1015]